jgi:hypothetical protein
MNDCSGRFDVFATPSGMTAVRALQPHRRRNGLDPYFGFQRRIGVIQHRINRARFSGQSQCREGFDPTIGIMHEGSDGSSKFIFDLMEPERPRVDRVVLDFVKRHVFDRANFVIRSDRVCRLNPEMARMVVARVLT